MATGSHADEITAALKPTTSQDINSGAELHTAFGWFRDMLATRPGKYGELYQRWNGHPAAKQSWPARPWNPEDDRLLDELGGIDFGPLLADSQRFANLRGAGEEMRLGAESIRDRLHDAWSGPSAQAAVDRVDQVGKAAATFRDILNQFAAALDLARSTTREAIAGLRAGGIQPFDLPGGVEFRRQMLAKIDSAMAGQDPFGRPWTPAELRQPNLVNLNAGSWGYWWSNETINVLDAFCDSYANAITQLRTLLTDTTTAITDSWAALNDALKRIQSADLDPFGKLAPAVTPGTQPSQGGVTIDDGQRRISVTRPPGAGDHLSLTMDDGRNYDLNLQPAAAPPPPPAPSGPATTPPPASDGGGPGGGGPGGASGGGVAGAGLGGGGGGGSSPAETQAPLTAGTMTGAGQPGGQPDTPDGKPAAMSGMVAGPPAGGPQGGGMPMGGMAGAGGGQGGDSERKASKWRTQGDLFDDALGEAIPMVIGDDDPYDSQRGR
jgi:uncharacterized protein YukE